MAGQGRWRSWRMRCAGRWSGEGGRGGRHVSLRDCRVLTNRRPRHLAASGAASCSSRTRPRPIFTNPERRPLTRGGRPDFPNPRRSQSVLCARQHIGARPMSFAAGPDVFSASRNPPPLSPPVASRRSAIAQRPRWCIRRAHVLEQARSSSRRSQGVRISRGRGTRPTAVPSAREYCSTMRAIMPPSRREGWSMTRVTPQRGEDAAVGRTGPGLGRADCSAIRASRRSAMSRADHLGCLRARIRYAVSLCPSVRYGLPRSRSGRAQDAPGGMPSQNVVAAPAKSTAPPWCRYQFDEARRRRAGCRGGRTGAVRRRRRAGRGTHDVSCDRRARCVVGV